jgi:starvation-inducible outer membrane lipoprotein
MKEEMVAASEDDPTPKAVEPPKIAEALICTFVSSLGACMSFPGPLEYLKPNSFVDTDRKL